MVVLVLPMNDQLAEIGRSRGTVCTGKVLMADESKGKSALEESNTMPRSVVRDSHDHGTVDGIDDIDGIALIWHLTAWKHIGALRREHRNGSVKGPPTSAPFHVAVVAHDAPIPVTTLCGGSEASMPNDKRRLLWLSRSGIEPHYFLSVVSKRSHTSRFNDS
jgi:hypothetical protein